MLKFKSQGYNDEEIIAETCSKKLFHTYIPITCQNITYFYT